MYYAILNQNAIIAYGRARDLWPDVSFPVGGPNAEFLQENNAQPVNSEPTHDRQTEQLEATEPYLQDGVVYNRRVVPIPLPPLTPEWVGFGAALGTDQQVNQFVGSLIQAAPVLHLMVGVGLGQAAQGDPQTFLTAWGMGLQTGLVTPELAAHVVELSKPYKLPADFVAALVP